MRMILCHYGCFLSKADKQVRIMHYRGLRDSTVIVAGLLGLCLSVASCGTNTVASSTTSTRKVSTTTVAVTTTTATSAGGYIATSTCPNLPTESSGYSSIADNGTNIFYLVAGPPSSVLSICQTQLKDSGWKILAGGTGTSAGGGFSATMGSAFAQIQTSGNGSTTYVGVCTWPTKPVSTQCNTSG